MIQVDDNTLRYTKRHFSKAFQREIEMASEEHGVSEEEVMRDRLRANVAGAPLRYALSPRRRMHLAVDNT